MIYHVHPLETEAHMNLRLGSLPVPACVNAWDVLPLYGQWRQPGIHGFSQGQLRAQPPQHAMRGQEVEDVLGHDEQLGCQPGQCWATKDGFSNNVVPSGYLMQPTAESRF